MNARIFLDHIRMRLLTEVRIGVMTFARHTTQVFRVLDLTAFGVLKGCPRYQLPSWDDRATVKFIVKVYHDFRQTMVQPNGWNPFGHLNLTLTQEVSHVGFYSTTKS
jgi:hypothetical protein